MSHTLTVELTDELYASLQRQAQATGTSPAQLVATSLERQFGLLDGSQGARSCDAETEKQAARARFERHFGAVNLGHATGVDNEGIDADLAAEYADDHEEK